MAFYVPQLPLKEVYSDNGTVLILMFQWIFQDSLAGLLFEAKRRLKMEKEGQAEFFVSRL